MTVALDPVPAIAPGFIVHVPVAGRPLNTTLPVGFEQEEGCVIVPTVGMSGIPVGARMITLAEGSDVQPDVSETVKL
jgi:hypothetical protein